jgi:iron complex outermembrane receptor protein
MHAGDTGPILRDLTFEQLAELTVVTVSKKEEPLFRAAAAVAVLTAEDIQRSGASTLPEALRYVPGLEVAQINAHDWAISARGFNSRYANKQLVLEDGRTVYSPFSGGVYWELVGPPVGEIAQIEIIRGPGATVWGANAMNGVINIVTKPARETQGGVISVSSGTGETESAYVGYGFQPGVHTWARVYTEALQAGPANLANGSAAGDAWEAFRAGVRLDHDFSDSSQLFIQSEYSTGRFDDPGNYPMLTPPFQARIPSPAHMSEGHVLTRWTREFASDARLTLQGFWSREQRTQFRNDFANDTFDLELTHQFAAGERQSLVWGGGFRRVTHQLDGKIGVVFPEPNPKDEVVNIFVQDDIQLRPRQLSLTVGTKVEHNNVTELELEPSVRLVWESDGQQTVWAAVSRAVHTPSVLERDIRYDAAVAGPPPTIIRQISEGNSGTEEQISYELGYRLQPATQFSLDATVFYNDLPKVQAFHQGAPFPEANPAPFHFVLPLQFDKTGLSGESHGMELAARWQAAEHWRLFAEYSYLEVKLNTMPGLSSFSARSPRNRGGVRSSLDFADHWQLDAGVRYVSATPGTSVAGYFAGDVQLLWRPNDRWELSVVGRNLFESQRAEIVPVILSPTVEIPREFFAKIAWKFP